MSKNKRKGFHSQRIYLSTGMTYGLFGVRSMHKADESKKISDSVQEFIKNGGEIEKIEEGESAYRKGLGFNK